MLEALISLRTALDQAITWTSVHRLPAYAYFHHGIHVSKGVACETCHGRIDQMAVVEQVSPMSMGWCLDCHRAPEQHLRDPALVTTMGLAQQVRADDASFDEYVEANRARIAAEGIQPPQNCSACHY